MGVIVAVRQAVTGRPKYNENSNNYFKIMRIKYSQPWTKYKVIIKAGDTIEIMLIGRKVDPISQ